ncbi:AMP-binding protein [Plebeiibacterium sediminum]|uniref:AMP-binding protein n=1 Tax=Plebeiibacterium sediminum TaxID=2992112 RepID=A0AAE3M856_9BACT|nr:AMP-binding protein [Plebeiobacterium sediminum]MCW3788585.1 AMP-binding protein [Plebeiobacterium sediminum]
MGETTMKLYNSITLNGAYLDGPQLVDYCKNELASKKTPDWLVDIYRFLLEWTNDSEEIKAHTSGSTGEPKLILLKKKHMIASAIKTNSFLNLSKEKSALLCLSANYIAGKMMIVRALVSGFNLITIQPSGNPLENLNHSIDFTAMVPLQVSNCIGEVLKGEKVKQIIIGGGAISKTLVAKLRNSQTVCYETYGMTETVSHVAIKKVGDEVFEAMPGVAFSLDDRNCLVIEANDIADSVIVTNDIVNLISDQKFIWLGRFDNIINTGGIKVVPEEIEAKLTNRIPGQFYISSIPDVKLGEKLVLVVEENNVINDISQIKALISHLSNYEQPKQVCIVQKFPLTETDKIKRADLKQLIKL